MAACSICGPMAPRSIASGSGTRIAHCGLPIATCWKRKRLPVGFEFALPVRGPSGKLAEVRCARPMSTVHVVGLVIVGRISPASVWMLNVSASVQPVRLR